METSCPVRVVHSDPQEALQLLTSWDHQRIRDAAQHKGYVRMLFDMLLCKLGYTFNLNETLWYNLGTDTA